MIKNIFLFSFFKFFFLLDRYQTRTKSPVSLVHEWIYQKVNIHICVTCHTLWKFKWTCPINLGSVHERVWQTEDAFWRASRGLGRIWTVSKIRLLSRLPAIYYSGVSYGKFCVSVRNSKTQVNVKDLFHSFWAMISICMYAWI